MNNLKLRNCFIAVHDHDEALAFYRDLLQLEVRADVKYEGMRWTTVGPKGQPDVNIVLEPPLADPPRIQCQQGQHRRHRRRRFRPGGGHLPEQVRAVGDRGASTR